MIPTSIDGTDITGATIDGTDVTEITVDGDTVFTAETIVDNFEPALYGNVGATLSTYYTGDVGSFTRQTSIVQEGSRALRTTTSDDFIVSMSGLPNYPSRGDTFRCFVRPAGRFAIFSFAVQSAGGVLTADRYAVFLSADDNTFRLDRVDGSFNVLFNQSFPHSGSNFYEVVVDFQSGGLIDVTVNDTSGTQLENNSATDTTYNSGGIAFRASGGGADAIFDDYKIL